MFIILRSFLFFAFFRYDLAGYDRYLPRCREDGKAVLIAFDVQETGALVTEATDVPIRLAVTESGVKRVREPAPEGAKEESMK